MSSRGKPRLADLSYTIPTREDLEKVTNTVFDSPPIVAAILGSALVEHELETLLRLRFPKITDSVWATMLREGGPFSTFDQKITASFAFRIFDESTKDNLKIIKNIRNVFAHSKMLVTFEHELVTKELQKVKIPSYRKKTHRNIKSVEFNGQHSYVILCSTISNHLGRKYLASLKAKNSRYKKRVDFYEALIGSFRFPEQHPGSGPQSFPQSQSGGPSSPIQGGLLAGLLPYLEGKKK